MNHHAHEESHHHNMMIVGQQTVFLSHLPMFSDPPHRFQVLLEATFTKAGMDPQKVYADDRLKHPGLRMYTLMPEKFVLTELLPQSGGGQRTSFKADIFRGHLERDPNQLLVKGAEVKVTRVIHFREFDPETEKLGHLEYLLFGKGQELFLAHFISGPGDFDQILSVSIPDHSFSDEELALGLNVSVESRPNTVDRRLGSTPNEEVEAVVRGGLHPGTRGRRDLPVNVKAGVEFYLEEGELRVPADFETTRAEREAGF